MKVVDYLSERLLEKERKFTLIENSTNLVLDYAISTFSKSIRLRAIG